MEAILQIEFMPSFATGQVTPSAPQYAGMQGDKNAAYVCFIVPSELCGENYRYHIECTDGCGAQIVSQPLPIDSEQKVGMLLGQDITGAGGQVLLRLVVTCVHGENNVAVARSFEGRVYFADAKVPSEEEIHAAAWRNMLRNLLDGSAAGAVRGVNAAALTDPIGNDAVALGQRVQATGVAAVASGYDTHAAGDYSTAAGVSTTAEGIGAHAEGIGTKAQTYAHAEGSYTHAAGDISHAEGSNTYAAGVYAHAEGLAAKAEGEAAHAEGHFTAAVGKASHAQGSLTRAEGVYSHAAGLGTVASGQAQTAVGQYNAADADALFVVGNGTDDEQRQNAFVVRRDGSVLANGQPLAGGRSEEWRLLRDDTLTEDAATYVVNSDADGNPFAVKKLRVEIYADTTNGVYTSGNTIYDLCKKNDGQRWARIGYSSAPLPSTDGRVSYIRFDAEIFEGRVFATYSAHKNLDGFAYNQTGDPASHFSRSPAWPIEDDAIKMFRVGTTLFHAGTRFVVWGVDA